MKSMQIKLRKAVETDWPAVLYVMNAAAPWTPRENQEWLSSRMRFDQTGYLRRHYVAQDTATGNVVGYGGIEGGQERDRFRIFLVMAPDLLTNSIGDLIYEQLMAELTTLKAATLWAREDARDLAMLRFLTVHGFTETNRETTPGGTEVVMMEMTLS